MDAIYLDNNATTRPAPEVVAAMSDCLRDGWGNPSSMHAMGQAAQHAIEEARAQVAALIGAEPREIVFTSGGTEADNLAILGTLAAAPAKRHVVTTAVEHPAVLDLCRRLEKEGYAVTYVGVDREGRIDVDEFAAALRPETAVASVMHANNETGVMFPVERLAEVAAERGVPLHVDAVQSAGKVPLDVRASKIALMSVSAHKVHGPKGIGALLVRRGVRVRGRQIGGHQERDLRPGTENVPGIVGFGVAADLARRELPHTAARIAALRDRLEARLLERIDYARVNGDRVARVPNTTNIGFESLEADAILIALSEAGVCVSAGAACSSGSLEPSHVQKAMGIDPRFAHGAIRFSLSRYTSDDEIDRALEIVPAVLTRLASLTAA